MLFINPIHLIISVAFSSSVTPCFFAISFIRYSAISRAEVSISARCSYNFPLISRLKHSTRLFSLPIQPVHRHTDSSVACIVFRVCSFHPSRIPSSIRLTSSTLTVSSPKMPRNRPSVQFWMISRTSSSVISFAFAMRAT